MCKVLMHCGVYADIHMLEKVIYATKKPFLCSKNDTIEALIERVIAMMDMACSDYASDRYFENLSKGELVDVCILIVPHK